MDFGRYRLVKELGRGGMAIVSRAVVEGPLNFSRELVIKRMLPEMARDPSFVHMLATEARLSARLRHPGIVQVYEFGQVDGDYYLAMELVDGASLSTLMRACAQAGMAVPVGVACLVVSQVAAALAYAHALTDEQGRPLDIVHRDVTPTNIMLTPFGAAKLLDFGIAKAADRVRLEQTQTEVGTIRGKISYLSPEQANGMPVDKRSDLFSLGTIFHELLTLQPLFRRGNDFETLRRIRDATVTPPSNVVEGIPPAVDAVVLRMLARNPDERFASGEGIVAALAPITRQLQVDALTLQEFLRTAPVVSGPSAATPQARLRAVSPLGVPLLDAAKTLPRATPTPPGLQAVREALPLLPEEPSEEVAELLIESLSDPLPGVDDVHLDAVPSSLLKTLTGEEAEEELDPMLGAETLQQPAIEPLARAGPWPTVVAPRTPLPGPRTPLPALPPSGPPAHRVRTALVWAGALVALLFLADVARRFYLPRPASAPQVTALPTRPAAPPATTTLDVPELVTNTPDAAAPTDPPERLRTRVRLTIAGPSGADVFVDGERAGKLPFRGKFPRASGTRHIEILRPGYRTWIREVGADADVALVAKLSRLRGTDAGVSRDPFD